MSRNLKHFWKLIWQSMLFWMLAFSCFAVFRFYGLDQEIGIRIKEDMRGKTFIQPFIVLSVLGLLLGALYAGMDFFYNKYASKKMALGFNLMLRTFLYFVVTVFLATLTIGIASQIFDLDFDISRGWWLRNKSFWSVMFYIVIASFVFSFIKIATERFGRGVFLKMLLGRYRNPREEERIFMFLDLKDSTTIAERLGHRKYSQFIQDCFFDLNEVVLDYSAEIYQYVGDEAVLSWPYKNGLANNNCVGVFFAFEEQRKSREEYYLDKYGFFPEFKAGLHGGTLMAAEVGFVRKELAYHGDVINTSARIQAECNRHNVTLLLSEILLKDLNIESSVTSKSLGNVLLKGKQKQVKIHTLSYHDTSVLPKPV